MLDSLRALSAEAPVVVAVDDFQWLDTASARTLVVRAPAPGQRADRRADHGALGRGELERGLASGAAERLAVGPLGVEALFGILKEDLGLELSRPQLTQLREMTGGNPFFALEIGRELMLGAARPGRPLRIPGSVREVVGERLARLPTRSREVLLLAAALGRPTVGVLTAAHGEPSRASSTGLEQAARGRSRRARRGADPLRPSAARLGLLRARRRRGGARDAHSLLAGVVVDDEERARHLALAADGPDAGVAAALDEAAPRALGRGAPAAAAELCEIAGAAHASRRSGGAAPAAARGGRGAPPRRRPPPGRGHPRRACSPRRRRDRSARTCSFALARARRADLPTIAMWCEHALAETGDDHRRAAEILAFLSWMRLLEGHVRDALAHARGALGHAELAGDDELLARAIARVAMAETWTLEVTPGLLERGVAIEEGLARPLEFHESARVTLARRLMCSRRLRRRAAVSRRRRGSREGARRRGVARARALP